MITVRAMKKADVKSVYEIEVLSFRTPWSLRSLMGELKNSVAHYAVMELDGEIVGYCGMWVLFEEAHVTNIAKMLLHGAMRAAASFGAEMMTLEVRETNTVAQNMYADMDFLQQGRRKRYYSDTGEDALLLWDRNILQTIEKNACLQQNYLLQFDSFLKGE